MALGTHKDDPRRVAPPPHTRSDTLRHRTSLPKLSANNPAANESTPSTVKQTSGRKAILGLFGIGLALFLLFRITRFTSSYQQRNLLKSSKPSSTDHDIPTASSPDNQQSDTFTIPNLAIDLHPGDHSARSPRVQHYSWSITTALRRPDGVLKLVYLVNGHLPGPLIEARSGDLLVIEVHNDIHALESSPNSHSTSKSTLSHSSESDSKDPTQPYDDDLTIHWHGLRLFDANRMDGAIGFTQHGIRPGENFTYEIPIGDDESGTFWWHAHSGAMRADGVFGGLVVHRPSTLSSSSLSSHTSHDRTNSAERSDYLDDDDGNSDARAVQDLERSGAQYLHDFPEQGLLMIGDWYHRPARDVLSWYMRAGSFGNEPVPDSLLMNGHGRYQCDMAVRARPIDCVQKAKFDPSGLVNSSNLKGAEVIDNESPDVSDRSVLPPFKIPRGTNYRLRVVNTGSLAGISLEFPDASLLDVVTIDGGNRVMLNDHDSSTAKRVGILHPGERVDIILRFYLPSQASKSEFCVELDGENFRYPNPALDARQCFPIYLIDRSNPPKDGKVAFDSGDVETDEEKEQISAVSLQNLVSAEDHHLPARADTTFVLYTTTLKLARLSNVPHGFINHTTWKPSHTPLIDLNRDEWDEHQLVPRIPHSQTSPIDSHGTSTSPSEPQWVDIVLNNLDDGSHPFHLHGHNFYVLSAWGDDFTNNYWGSYNPFELAAGEDPPGGPYNLRNPVKRDTVLVPRRGYAVIRFRADNPGLWMWHCHVLWHMASGMAMAFEVAG